MHNKFLRFFSTQFTKWNWSHIFQSCIFHPRIFGPAFSTPYFRSSIFQSCIFSPAFSGPAFSGPVFSGPAFFYPGNLVPHFPVVSVALWSKWSLIGPTFSGPAFLVAPLTTYDVHLGRIRKRVVDFLLVLTELFSLGVTAAALRAKIDRKSATLRQRGQFDSKFQVKGVAPTNQFCTDS